MPELFVVLLKINLVLILFAATYYLILRRLTFYVLNRMFLIFGIVFSSVYPFINLTEYFSNHETIPAFIPQFHHHIKQLVEQDAVSVFWQGLTILFYLGVLFMALRLIIQFVSLHRLHKKSVPAKLLDFKVRILHEEVSPFSFWQCIYINPNLHQTQDLVNILEHEKVHVEDWHTLDIILAEICLVFYWFNPGVWLMKKAVKENIEFITDAKILRKGFDRKAYQYSLLEVGALQPAMAIANNFNLSDLKQRIKMMNAKRSSKVNLSRYLLILPILICITLAFTVDGKQISRSMAPLRNIIESQKIKQLVRQQPTGLISKVRKQNSIIHKSIPDSVKKIAYFFKTNLEVKDSTNQSINQALQKMVGTTVMMESADNADKKVFTQSFTFKDSLKLHSMLVNTLSDQEAQATFSKPFKGTIKKIVLIKTQSKVSDRPSSSDQNSAKQSGINYYIDGKPASNEDFKALSPNQISNINVMKGDVGIIQITTKQ